MFRNAALGPHHDATPKQFPSTAVGQHHDAAPRQYLGTVPGQHPGAAAEQYPGAASSQPRPAPNPPPLRIGPITTQHRIRFNPRSASSLQHPSTASGALPGTQKQKIGPNCNFFAIGNCCELPIANRGTKTQQKWHISSLKEPRRAPNRKKVAKIPSFLFFAMGPIAATGQIPRKCAEHHDQQSKIRNKKGARHADASKKPNRLKSTLPWHHTARNKHRVQPSTYRRSPLRPELRGCTGAR